MRAGGRLQAAIEILATMEESGIDAAAALAEWGRAHRFAGSSDRAAIANHLFDALRRRRSAAARLGSDTPRAAVLGAALRDPDELDAICATDRFAPEPLTAAERAALASFDAGGLEPGVAGDIPDWCVPEFAAAFGAGWLEEAQALAMRPPLDLRVNRLRATRAEVLDELRPHQPVETPISPDGLRIAARAGDGRHPNLEAGAAFAEGRIEIQDEASQIAACLAAQAGPLDVLDYCAGGGGKTLALAARMGNGGQIHAHDADPRRLAPIGARLRRAGCSNVRIVSGEAELRALSGRMDLVLVDAPCTGSGTWRRRPDAKWRLRPDHLAQRIAEQEQILLEASGHVRPGGRLVYVTCSVFPSENEERIDRFVAASPGFRQVDPAAAWQTSFPGHAACVHLRRNGLALTPARSGTDGFFVSILTRVD